MSPEPPSARWWVVSGRNRNRGWTFPFMKASASELLSCEKNKSLKKREDEELKSSAKFFFFWKRCCPHSVWKRLDVLAAARRSSQTHTLNNEGNPRCVLSVSVQRLAGVLSLISCVYRCEGQHATPYHSSGTHPVPWTTWNNHTVNTPPRRAEGVRHTELLIYPNYATKIQTDAFLVTLL